MAVGRIPPPAHPNLRKRAGGRLQPRQSISTSPAAEEPSSAAPTTAPSSAPASSDPASSTPAPSTSNTTPAPTTSTAPSSADAPSSAAPTSSSTTTAAPSSQAPPSSSSTAPPSSSATTTQQSSAPPPSSQASSTTSSPAQQSTSTTIVTVSASSTTGSSTSSSTTSSEQQSSTSDPGTTTSTTVVTASQTSAQQTTLTSASGIVTTNSVGSTVTTTPAEITSSYVTTSNGQAITVTQIIHNPSGSLDQGSSGSSTNGFFSNTGAVAGVFVVVGLVVVGIIIALGFLCFRRRRRQRLDREVTAAAVAASNQHSQRSPLDEDVGYARTPSGAGAETSESYPSTVNQPMTQYNNYGASYGQAGGYDPYVHDAGHSYAAAGYGTGAAAGYHGLQPEGQGTGYYFDPAQAHEYQHPQGPYDDAYGGYSGGEGSVDTPMERENPLHVANPSGAGYHPTGR